MKSCNIHFWQIFLCHSLFTCLQFSNDPQNTALSGAGIFALILIFCTVTTNICIFCCKFFKIKILKVIRRTLTKLKINRLYPADVNKKTEKVFHSCIIGIIWKVITGNRQISCHKAKFVKNLAGVFECLYVAAYLCTFKQQKFLRAIYFSLITLYTSWLFLAVCLYLSICLSFNLTMSFYWYLFSSWCLSLCWQLSMLIL